MDNQRHSRSSTPAEKKESVMLQEMQNLEEGTSNIRVAEFIDDTYDSIEDKVD